MPNAPDAPGMPEASPEPEGASSSDEDAIATPIISDGAIYIGPMTEPEPEPIPDPEPAAAFVQAYGAPADPEPQAATGSEATAEPEAVTAPPASEPQASAEAEAEPAPAAPAASAPASEPVSAPPAAPEPADVQANETSREPEAPQSEAEAAPEPSPAPDPQARFAPFADAPIVPPNPARAHQTNPHPAGEALYQKGCLGAAWDDIVQTKGWFGKILLLGLISCVPVLNFYATGYAMRWSRELFLGKVAPMPQQIFGNRMFVNGFFAFVFALVLAIALNLCGFILDFIPFVGMLAYFVLAVLLSAFEYVAYLRIAVADRLGAGFDLTQIWRTCKRNVGALCCATIVPALIIGAIAMVIIFAITLIIGLPLMGSLFSTLSSGAYTGAESFRVIMGVLIVMTPLLVVAYIVSCFIGAFQTVLIMRATGHYVARYAQDWKNEQAVMSTAHINGI